VVVEDLTLLAGIAGIPTRSEWNSPATLRRRINAVRAFTGSVSTVLLADPPTESQIGGIKARFDFRDDLNIRQLLADAALRRSLEEGAEHLSRLGLSLRPRLEFSCEEERQLKLLVPTDLSPQEAYTKLARFDDDWWTKLRPNLRRLITVDVVPIDV